MSMQHFTVFRDYICTANPDGSVPLNAKVACSVWQQDASLISKLVAQANLAIDLHNALQASRKEAPEITSAFRKYNDAVMKP